ncbi:MAG TPA: bifunctional (p)ppGpp synthetase/guanosine-3',5'-bis(diphosphate) 3'-pyrophosphohydrolase [Clostridiales bacterium]|nr:bifunctional (p)ppGpp synthetase/guanosine-3',5'-bis(diphosphate) 3'-pyrophosphohydrolase [Clostridiales bacterium]
MATVMEEYERLEKKVLEYNPSVNVQRLRAAFEYAEKAHGMQKRKDGSPYITHPIAAAEIIAEMGLDEDAIIAAILHDVMEDTPVIYEDLVKKFGPSVATIVDGVTKLTRVVYTTKEEEQMENLRKMLMAMAKDIRVILIKIADRLHNMRTLEYHTEVKQREKALETMEIYAPIAHRLGMQKIKWELEDLSILYLDPIGYKEITDALEDRREMLNSFMESIRKRIEERLKEYGIQGKVYGRIKHIYSIYRKMYSQNKELSEVFDLCAFRVIVETINDCYNVLGHIHDLFKPVLGRFKDYIGTPKPNMYQSLHTTVIGSEGIPFEVQIRTWEMHRTAEYGIAAHWKYKEGIDKHRDEEKFAWIRSLLEAQQDTDATEFVHDLKIDMFSDEVFVFTPKGDVINLPAGATPIDFAYKIHSAVGNRMTGAKVNGRIATFDTVLENGDIVEIITSNSAKGPSRDWLNIAVSNEAKSKIKQWLKKEKREENIIHGKAAFEAELRRMNIPMSAVENEEVLPNILKKLAVNTMDDLYASIGFGGMTATRAVNRVRDELIKAAKPSPDKTILERINSQNPDLLQRQGKATNGIIVEGVDNCLIKFSRCCTPVPGDAIIGFITKGHGVSVHRQDCPNYLNSIMRPEEAGRWIRVSWAITGKDNYETAMILTANDRDHLVIDIATTLAAINAKVRALSVREIEGGKALAQISMEVAGRDELKYAMKKLSAIPGVLDVRRGGS